VFYYCLKKGSQYHLAQVGVLIPASIAEKLKHIDSSGKSFAEEVKEEITTIDNKKGDK